MVAQTWEMQPLEMVWVIEPFELSEAVALEADEVQTWELLVPSQAIQWASSSCLNLLDC